MIHEIRPNPVELLWGEGLLDVLMRLQQEGVRLTGIRLKTSSFVFLAWACGVDDPTATPRAVLRPGTHRPGRSVDWVSAQPSPLEYRVESVRVGPSFVLNAFGHQLVVTEDESP